MSFTPKHLTQGGQMTAYRLRMFAQVNQWIFHWILLLFFVATGGIFWAVTPSDVLRNGFWYWYGVFSSGLPTVMNRPSSVTWAINWHCGNGLQLCTTKMTLAQVLSDPWMHAMGAQLVANIKLCAVVCGTASFLLYCAIVWYVGRIGKKESEDQYISGMTLTDDVASVNRQLKKAGQKSDLQIGGLYMVKNAEVMNYLIHGTIGVGKSTLIRWLLDYIRRRGDRAIIYDSGGTFIETHFDERQDVLMNAHDKRCPNWVLWRECPQVVDYENLTASLIPVEGESDPFWVSSSRTIFSDTAMQFASDKDRSIEKFLTTLMSLDLKSLREFLKNTPSANLVEEKIEKTAISIRSVLTNYAKALRYLQGLDQEGKPEFSIREWMTEAKYDKSWLFISTTARHRKSVRPLISMWLSLATLYLQSMGENSDRRVWFILDELTSLQKIPELNETLAEARKFGGCFVIGIQNMPQLINIYGREMAKSIFDLLNTRAYGRSPSAEVAKIVEDELGHQRRREAREQNSYGQDSVRDGISLSRDKVNEPVVDYDQIMSMPNLRFYVRLPGEYPVVKLALKYRQQKKYHPALIERNFRDRLSPELEDLIHTNERCGAAAGIHFPSGDEGLEDKNEDTELDNFVNVSRRPSTQPLSEGSHAGSSGTVPADVAPVPANLSTQADEKTEKLASPSFHRTDPVVTPLIVTSSTVPVASPPVTPKVRDVPIASSSPDAEPSRAHEVQSNNVRAFPVRVSTAAPGAVTGGTDRSISLMPLDRIRRIQDRNSSNADESTETTETTESSTEPQGETPELQMEVETDERGALTLRTAGARKETHESRDETHAAESGRANRSMADDEQNILRHHNDYEAYQNMNEHHEPGGFER
ncbi:type IV conjugative transfer system coupling protein TraD [Acerihabitans sp. TG2]|uniref:type IV conjugative transfer system coupling protein TraD n=1 Tax=Acerihabitans sp. TG2 TaxID=3096008 RepID=UPI002B22EC01|nr:type IV conjugative transfer system coupling protein TraD [Acerihabitans sp. TG2]MEA9392709.1 type IV conjugative transfer system coupling protein TraD [Acerihabitans sp. TG2]